MDEEDQMRDFAKRLYELRQRKGQSARDLSLTLGFAPNYYSGLESAKNYPSMNTFFYLCDYFSISPREFFDYEDAAPERTGELYNELRKLDAKAKEQLLQLLRTLNSRK